VVCCTECGSEVVWRHDGIVLTSNIIVREDGRYDAGQDEIDFVEPENPVEHSVWCPHCLAMVTLDDDRPTKDVGGLIAAGRLRLKTEES
jgi:hypothetical protein